MQMQDRRQSPVLVPPWYYGGVNIRKLWRGSMLAAAVLLISSNVAADNTYQGFTIVNVIVNGQALQSDVPAVNFFGRTVLPLRAVAEAVGMDVQWDANANTATLTSEVVKTDNATNQQLSDLKGQVAQLQSDKSQLQAQLVQASTGPTATEAVRLKAMTEADFEKHVQENFGVLGGNTLSYGRVLGYNSYYFTCADSEACKNISIKDRLNWLNRFALTLAVRYPDAQYSGSLWFDYSYSKLDYIPDRYIGDAHLQSNYTWRVHHFVMGVSRVDLKQFGGLFPATISVVDD